MIKMTTGITYAFNLSKAIQWNKARCALKINKVNILNHLILQLKNAFFS